jgi:hypothetical protein
MLTIEASHEVEPPDEGHDRWLAMKSAYAEYMRASEALDCTTQVSDAQLIGENSPMSRLGVQQRVAFERYLEARMEFLEFQYDARNRRSVDSVEPPRRRIGFLGIDSRFANCGWTLRALAIILLITMASLLVREQKHMRHLELAYNELRASLTETRGGSQVFAKKVDDRAPAPTSTIQQIEHSAPPIPAPQKKTELKRPGERRWRRLPAQPGPANKLVVHREGISTPESSSRGARSYHSFLLSPFHRFKRIGPIEITLRSFDSQRGCTSLSIVSGSSKVEAQCLRLHQPLWINAGYHAQRVQLVADWIDGHGIHGHLIEFRDEKSDLSASRLKSGPQANP